MKTLRRSATIAVIGLLVASCRAVDDPFAPAPPRDDGAPATVSVPQGSDVGPLGSMGRELLSSAVPTAVLEIDTGRDVTLSSDARAALSDALRDHGQKREVTATGSDTLPSQQVYSTEDLLRISLEHRGTKSSADRVSVHVLVLQGRFENERTVGVAFEATTFALFPEQIRSGLLPSTSGSRVEVAVAIHELGHLFGLVDITGEGSFHEAADHPNHSRNEGSVMFWAVEDVGVGSFFRDGPPTTFDADDRREMERIRAS